MTRFDIASHLHPTAARIRPCRVMKNNELRLYTTLIYLKRSWSVWSGL